MQKLSASQKRKYSGMLQAQAQFGVLDYFTPNPGGQVAFNQSQANEILLFGGNNSGKTYTGIVKCGHHIIPEKDRKTGKPTGFTIHPHRRIRTRRNGILGWISSYSQDIQKDAIDPRIDKILLSYTTKAFKDKGVYQYIEFETGTINLKTQTQETPSHKAAKLDFIHADEPHRKAIYNEYLSRLLDKKGTIWSTLTPVIDAKSSALKAAEIIWYMKDIIEPYQRDPDAFPLRDVIFLPIEENARWTDVDFAKNLFVSMSREEQNTRLTGIPIDFIGDNLFNIDMVKELEDYLVENFEISQPELGVLLHDAKETDDDQRIQFMPTKEFFPIEPDDGYIIKIWEHPVEFNDMGTEPIYVMAVDPAEGIPGRDYTAVYVIRSDTGGMVAALHGYLSELQLARELWKLGWYYSNYDYRRSAEIPAVLAIEVMGIGQATLGYLLHGNKDLEIEPYDPISLYRAPDLPELKLGLHMLGKEYGWKTTSGHRPLLLTQMRMDLQTSVDKIRRGEYPIIRDLGWVYDARHFVMDAAGKYQAAIGFHDDHLFAMALADMAAKQGQFTVPRHVVKEREMREDKVIYIDPESYKDPSKPPQFRIDREAMYDKVHKKNEKPAKIAWL